MLPLSSCATTKKQNNSSGITFPVFPSPFNPDGTPAYTAVLDDKGNVTGVTVPVWYWTQLGLYAANIKAVERLINKE